MLVLALPTCCTWLLLACCMYVIVVIVFLDIPLRHRHRLPSHSIASHGFALHHIAAAQAQNVGLISGACRNRCADWRLLRTDRGPRATSRRDVCAHREDPCTGRPTRESDCSDWQPTSALSAVDAALFDAAHHRGIDAQQGGVSQPQPQPTPTCMRRSCCIDHRHYHHRLSS